MTKFSEIYNGQAKWLEQGTIFVTLAGSRAYGTSTPKSDTDYRGIAIAPKNITLGFAQGFDQVVQNQPTDMVIYGLQKFMKLAASSNPNIIEILYTDPDDWHVATPIFMELYKHRDLFLSQSAKQTFSGYAISQLKRIKNHRGWLLNPPTHQPTRKEFGLNDTKKISKSVMGAFDNLADRHSAKFDGEVMQLLEAEKRYNTALVHWKQYNQWKRARNEARAKTEADNGFDTKHAMHLIRLMRMCKEILTDGKVVVKRPDAEELLAIRNGAWTYDELIEQAEILDAECEVLYKAGNHGLPRKPNMKRLNELCVRLIETHYSATPQY